MTLLVLILIPLLTAVLVGLLPERSSRGVSFLGSLVALGWGVRVAFLFDAGRAADMQLGASWSWIPALGLDFSLGMDSVSLLLVLLTVFLMPLTLLGSFSAVQKRVKEFFVWLLILQAAMTGVFLARDLIVFYICFEFTLLPMFLLIAVYGSTNRAKASIVFFLYTFTGSIITLAGLIYVAYFHATLPGESWTFDIAALTSSASQMSRTEQAWVLLALCCGLAVKVPLFPVHTWLPLAHTEAPTAGSVILAAILLKLGTYGLYRFALPLCPSAIYQYAPLVAVLCIIGIIYAALVCWVQRDIKKLIAYSSVSHLGFCVLGMMALNVEGISGSIAYMINHGLSTGALFLCVGMIYERYHTHEIDAFSGLGRIMPVWTFFMVFFVMASVGLPGLNGFIGEFLALVGTFTSGATTDGFALPGSLGPWYAASAGVGMILTAVYLLYLVGKIIFGPLTLPDLSSGRGHGHGADDDPASVRNWSAPLPRDLSLREITVLVPLAVACIWLGVRPSSILDPMAEPVAQIVNLIDRQQRLSLDHDDDETFSAQLAPVNPPAPVDGDIRVSIHPVEKGK